MNKYTIVPIDEDVLNGSSNEDTEGEMLEVRVSSSSVDPRPPGSGQKQKRNIWEEIEFLASSNDRKNRSRNDVDYDNDDDDGEAGKNPGDQVRNGTTDFIFPFLNSSNSARSEFKRDYFSFDDEDFNLLVPETSPFPSIDSSSSDDDDGGKFYYRPGRYRLDTIQEENEEDLESSYQEDSTDQEFRSAIILNSSFAASNESEGSAGFINLDKKLSLESLKERRKRLQERYVRNKKPGDDSSTDEESGIPIFAKNSIVRRRLKSKRLLDMVPLSNPKTTGAEQPARSNNGIAPRGARADNLVGNIKPGTSAFHCLPSSGPAKITGPLKSSANISSASVPNENPPENSKTNSTDSMHPKLGRKTSPSVEVSSQGTGPANIRIVVSTTEVPREKAANPGIPVEPKKCIAITETNPSIGVERFQTRQEESRSKTPTTTITATTAVTSVSRPTCVDASNGSHERQSKSIDLNREQRTATVGSDGWSTVTDFLQSSKFSLDSPSSSQHPSREPDRRGFASSPSDSPDARFRPSHPVQTTSTQTNPSSAGNVYVKYYPDTPRSTSATQTKQNTQPPRTTRSDKTAPLQSSPSEPAYVFPGNLSATGEIQIDRKPGVEERRSQMKAEASTQVRDADPEVEVVKSRIANIKLKPPPSSVERQWNSLMCAKKPREIKVISKDGRLASAHDLQSHLSGYKRPAAYSNLPRLDASSNFNFSYHPTRSTHDLDTNDLKVAQKSDHHLKVKFSNGPPSFSPSPLGQTSNREPSRRSKTLSGRSDLEVESAVDLTRLGCREANIRSMSESELRVWLSLQKLDIPEWYLAYPDKNKEIADLKNTRSVSDIMADIEKLSLPGEKRILGNLNLTKSVPSLVQMQEQQQQHLQHQQQHQQQQQQHLQNHLQGRTAKSKRWSTHLPFSYHPQNDSALSLPQHYRLLKWSLNDHDSDHKERPTSRSMKPTKELERKFTLPSDALKTNSREPPFRPMVMPPFEAIMKGIEVPKARERKGEVLSEKLVKQTIPPDADVSLESPHVIRIRRIRNPEEPQRGREFAGTRKDDIDNDAVPSNDLDSSDVAETHFPAESGGTIESILPQRSGDRLGVPYGIRPSVNDKHLRADQASLPHSNRSSRNFAEGDFSSVRRVSQHHDERPLRVSGEVNSTPGEHQQKNVPDDSGFGSDMTPLVSSHAKRGSTLGVVHQQAPKSPSAEGQSSKKAPSGESNSRKFSASGRTILNPTKAPKDRSKLSNFPFGLFRSSKKTILSTSGHKNNSTQQGNSINKLSRELQRGSFAPFIEHRV